LTISVYGWPYRGFLFSTQVGLLAHVLISTCISDHISWWIKKLVCRWLILKWKVGHVDVMYSVNFKKTKRSKHLI